jgi:predicted nucleic acid-binding protein
MPVRVVDASALGALVFGEAKAEEIARTLGDSPMAAPALIWFEVASICLRKIKAHPAQREQILRAFMMAGKLAIEIVEVDHRAIVNLADETGLTTYDASYLWLARHLKGELITLDGKMQRAAKSL